MPTSVKITIIGAGSATFSATIVKDLCVNQGLHGSHIVLMDTLGDRADKVMNLAKRISDELKAELTFSVTTDRHAALIGSDFVINTAQDGGHNWVEAQRCMAEKHGYYRGAGLQSLGQMDLLLDVARDIELICPDAWLIQVSNPVFEGCTLITRQTKVKVIGLCHGHYGYHDIARTLGLELEYVTAQMPGFNHWIWMTDFRYKGRDAYPLIDEWIEAKAKDYWCEHPTDYGDNQMSPAAIHQYRHYGLMPIGDTPRFAGWWYNKDLETKKRWYGEKWGGFDSEIGWTEYLKDVNGGIEKIEQVIADRSKSVTETYKPKQSREQIVPIIDSLVNDVECLYQVNIPNRGHIIKGFPEDLVIECQGVISGAGVRGVTAPPFPRKLMVEAMIPRWHKAELAVEAAISGDRDILLSFLLHDQKTGSMEQAKALIDKWLGDPRNKRLGDFFKK